MEQKFFWDEIPLPSDAINMLKKQKKQLKNEQNVKILSKNMEALDKRL